MGATKKYPPGTPQGNRMGRAIVWLVMLCLAAGAGCAQVPKQSVELSATVGRDVAQVYQAHRELALILYERIENDINRFVDDVYAPYQVEKLLQADREDFQRGDPNSLFSALDVAVKKPDDPALQKKALAAMEVFVQVVRDETEAYRQERLAPVRAQEKSVLAAIDRSYHQIHYANSIVTGHLASVAQVYDAQEQLLKEIGLEGLQEEIGQKLAHTSNAVAGIVDKALATEAAVTRTEAAITDLTKQLQSACTGEQP